MFFGRSLWRFVLLGVLIVSACGGRSSGDGKGGTGGTGGRGGAAGSTAGRGGGSGTGGTAGAGATGGSATGTGGGAAGTGGGAGAGGSTAGAGGNTAGAGGVAGGGGTGGAGGSTGGRGGTTGGSGGTTGGSGGVAGGGGSTAGAGGGAAGTGGAGGTGGSTGAGGTGGVCTTSVSGTVYDPAGTLPLYNVRVYSPTQPLADFSETVGCLRCAPPSGAPAAVATSDVYGKFKLEGIPAGANVPLVLEVGKWRRQVLLPSVAACTDTPITDANLTRLPRTQSEGHMPRMAMSTGNADALECFLRRIGIADTEFTADTGSGRVHLYAGGGGTNSFMTGGAFSPATTLWSNPSKLATYDMIAFSCEGSTSAYRDQKPQTSIDNIQNYANLGGRLLFGHLHFYWLQNASELSGTGTYAQMDALNDVTATVNQTHAGGMALAQWLAGPGVNASTTLGQVPLSGAEHSVASLNAPATEWIYVPGSLQSRAVEFLSFQTPVPMPAAQQCGKVVFTDVHVQKSVASGGGGDDSDPDKPFPSGCKTNEMTPQMKALEFLFFDLGACL